MNKQFLTTRLELEFHLMDHGYNSSISVDSNTRMLPRDVPLVVFLNMLQIGDKGRFNTQH